MIPDALADSLSYLLREHGQMTDVRRATAINIALGLVGVAVWWLASGVLSFVGAVWAILHAAYLLSWVVGL